MQKLSALVTIIAVMMSSSGDIMYSVQGNMEKVVVNKIVYNEQYDCLDLYTTNDNGDLYILSDLYVSNGDEMYIHIDSNGNVDLATMTISVDNETIKSTLYPLSTTVTNIDFEMNTVYCQDYNGNIWSFRGIENYDTGDICALLMNDNGTTNIYDDEVVSTRYCGRE